MEFSAVYAATGATGWTEWIMRAAWTPCAADVGAVALCLAAADATR